MNSSNDINLTCHSSSNFSSANTALETVRLEELQFVSPFNEPFYKCCLGKSRSCIFDHMCFSTSGEILKCVRYSISARTGYNFERRIHPSQSPFLAHIVLILSSCWVSFLMSTADEFWKLLWEDIGAFGGSYGDHWFHNLAASRKS